MFASEILEEDLLLFFVIYDIERVLSFFVFLFSKRKI